MDLEKVKELLEKDYGYSNLKEENEYSWFINGILKDTIEIVKLNYTHSCEKLKCDCGNTEDVKNIPICASCYNPHTGEW